MKFNRLDPTQHKELVVKYNQTFESMKKIFYADPSVDQIAMEQKLIQIGFVHHDVVGMDEPDQGDMGELTDNSLPSDHIFSDQSDNDHNPHPMVPVHPPNKPGVLLRRSK